MAIGSRTIGSLAIGAGPRARSVQTHRTVYSASGAIGTFAIGAGDLGAQSTSFTSSGGSDVLIHWRRRGRR